MEMRDVIIAGGGPAGLWAGYILAKNGKNVLIMERKRNYDELRRACSMQFIIDDDYEGEGIIPREGELYFPKSDFSVPYHGKLLPLYNKYYHSPGNHVMRFALEDGKKPFSYKFDKQFLLKELYDLCLEAGVEFMLNTSVRAASDKGEYMVITAITGEEERTDYNARKFIDAEGVNAFVSRKLGIMPGRPQLAAAMTVKFLIQGMSGIEKNSWNLFYGQIYHSNAAVIIGPSLMGDDYHEVTITSSKESLPSFILFDLVADSPLAKCFKNSKLIDKTGCSVKAFMPIKEPCKGNAIVIGDAAAFIEVETQGALLCGFHAANAVLKELKGEDGWRDYTDWWQTSFEFNGEDFLKVSQGYAMVPYYTDDELDYLFALAEKTCLPGTYSQYKTPAYMWGEFLSHLEQIKKERPEIYAKIQNLNNSSIKDSF